jgi:hypothetical protein
MMFGCNRSITKSNACGSKYPAQRQSSFRESADIAAASIALNVVVIDCFSIVRILLPNLTPNGGALSSAPHKYFLAKYRPWAAWAFAEFLPACGIGFGAGSWIKPSGGSLDTSAWWEMFEVDSRMKKFVSCQLLDGSFISGELYSFSTDCHETEDLELAL